MAERTGHIMAAVARANTTARRRWTAERHGIASEKTKHQSLWSEGFTGSCRQVVVDEPAHELLALYCFLKRGNGGDN